VVDIQHRALRAFEHHRPALVERAVDEDGGIGHEGHDLLSRGGVFTAHAVGIERLGVEQGVGNHVLFAAGP